MRRLYSILSNSVFALQVLLLYLVLFESNLSLPPLVQTFGRLHPLLLHLPIGWLVLLAVTPLLSREMSSGALAGLQRFLLHITALTTVLTALFGLFLAQEGGYGPALLWRHKWAGITLSWLTYGLLLLNLYQPERRRRLNIGIVAALLLYGCCRSFWSQSHPRVQLPGRATQKGGDNSDYRGVCCLRSIDRTHSAIQVLQLSQ